MSTEEQIEVSESQIASHWKEEDLIPPSAGFIAQANMADPTIREQFGPDNFPESFRK